MAITDFESENDDLTYHFESEIDYLIYRLDCWCISRFFWPEFCKKHYFTDNNHFIDRQRSKLLRKVTQEKAILDGLLLHDLLTLRQYDDIQSKSNNWEKMQALYNIVEDWSEGEKDTVYDLLKLHNGELIRELENLDKGPPSRLPGKRHFIERHRSKIARTITVADPILDGLLLRTVLKPKQYNYIQSHSTNQKKMLALYGFVEDWNEGDKDIMYALLKQYNGELIRELKNQDKESSLLLDKNHFIDRQQSNLLGKVTQVNPVMDGLLLHTKLTLEQYNDIQSKFTNQEKMQALYNFVEDWSEVEKDTVYELIKLHNAELIRELENLDKGPLSQLPGKKHFIERHYSKIVRIINVADPILDGLLLRTVLKPKQYSYIQSHSTNQKKMLALYGFVKDWSEGDKDIMYALLKQHNGELIRELENQDKGTSSLLLDKNRFIDRQRSKIIQKVNGVNPILAGLQLQALLTPIQYCYIKIKATNQEKMKALYSIVEDWSEGDKDVVYELLKQHNGELTRELENQEPPSLLPEHDFIESKTTNQEKMEAPYGFVKDWMENARDVLYHALKCLNVMLRQAENQVTTIYSQTKMNLPGVNKAMGTFSNSQRLFFIPFFICALLAGFPAASCECHRLWYGQTGILQAGKNPVEFQFQTAGFVDDQQIDKYTHLTRRDKPVATWMEKHEDEEYWNRETLYRIGWEKVFKDNLQILWHRVNETSMPVILQHFYGCELGEDGSLRGYYHYGLNGRDFLYLDEQSMMWTPGMHEAQISAERWNSDPSIASDVRNYLAHRCPEALKKYIDFMKKDPPNKTVPPEVKVWGRKTEEETKLHCLVYGFCPRAVDVKWVKNGVDHILSHQMSPILPHPDGTYQIRVDVEVPTNEEDSYSCHVDHNSLEAPISVIWDPTIQETNRKWILLPLASTTALIFIISLVFVIRYQRSRIVKPHMYMTPSIENSMLGRENCTPCHENRNKMIFDTYKNGMAFNI